MASASSAFFPWLLCALAVSLVYQRSVFGSEISAIEVPKTTALPSSVSLLDETELEYEEGDDEEADDADSKISLDGSIRTQQMVKPESTTKNAETKNPNKKKKRQGKKKGQKKQKQENPCNTTHQEYCFHGRCRYLEAIETVSCICDPNYAGTRCSERYMETVKDPTDISTAALAVVAVLLSAISFIAIVIIIVAHMQKKYSATYEGETEEKKKLRHENGDVDV